MALAIAASLLPCPLCGRRPSGRAGACLPCLTGLDGRPERSREDGVELLWLGVYDGAWLRAVRALKYGGCRALGATLGRRLGREVAAAGWPVGRVAAVPLHRARRARRGYDQAGTLAHAAAAVLAAPRVGGLRRVRATARQARRGGRRRRANVAGAFVAARLAPVPVVLIDDVWTTGATAGACRDAVLAAGAREVRVAVVARSAPPQGCSTTAVSTPSTPPTSTWG